MAEAEKGLWPSFGGRATLGGKLGEWRRSIIRLSTFAGAALLGLGLLCGAVNAGSDPTRRARLLPSVDNPYCAISTKLLPDFPEQATSMMDSKGRPLILVNSATLSGNPAYGHFLMAHECCHHTLGHVRRLYDGIGQVGPQPFYYIRPQLKQMELDADTCAVKLLKSTHETDAIAAARATMLSFGTKPTGAYYPTGIERADNIAKIAAED
jgi:hypothetical protein